MSQNFEQVPLQCLMMAITDKLVTSTELYQGLLEVIQSPFHPFLWLSARVRIMAENTRPTDSLIPVLKGLCERPGVDINAVQMVGMMMKPSEIAKAMQTTNPMSAEFVAHALVTPLKVADPLQFIAASLLNGPGSMIRAFDTADSKCDLKKELATQVDSKQFTDHVFTSAHSMAIVYLYYTGLLPESWKGMPNIQKILEHCRQHTVKLFSKE